MEVQKGFLEFIGPSSSCRFSNCRHHNGITPRPVSPFLFEQMTIHVHMMDN
jgi:hypothetical protein